MKEGISLVSDGFQYYFSKISNIQAIDDKYEVTGCILSNGDDNGEIITIIVDKWSLLCAINIMAQDLNYYTPNTHNNYSKTELLEEEAI
jgi:hypothetical protein